MRLVIPAENATNDAYVVAAPRACDAISATLRRAFEAERDTDPFHDLMSQLDLIKTQ